MTKVGQQLLVLLWRHAIIRRKRWFLTLLEFVIPLLPFVCVAIFKDILYNVDIDEGNDTAKLIIPEPVDLRRLGRPELVVYYPKNNLTEILMDRVGKTLGLREMKFYSDNESGYFGINDNSEIIEYLQNLGQTKCAYVEFKNMNTYALPDTFNYTIRMKIGSKTQTYSSMYDDELAESHMEFGQEYEEFVRLQWAIDKNYLELRSGRPLQQTMLVQEFPTDENSKIPGLLLMIVVTVALLLSLIINFSFTTARLLEERVSGVQEMIKMLGVSSGTLGLAHCVNLLPAGLLYSVGVAAMLTTGHNPIMGTANSVIVWLFLILHYFSLMALACACSYIFKTGGNAYTISSLIYVGGFIGCLALSVKLNKWVVIVTGLLPFFPANFFKFNYYTQVLYGKGLTFDTMMFGVQCSIFEIYIFLLVQIVLLLFLTWYLSMVRPGKYGIALPVNFLCQKAYWSKKHKPTNIDLEALAQEKTMPEGNLYEPLPPNSQVGIDVVHVTKVFGSYTALNNVSLPVLKGEITVLLGHNGAGKTTLMSIITGMISATMGKVFINGLDTEATKGTSFYQNLGYCPQENIFCSSTTVLQQVKLFTLLRGIRPWKKATEMSRKLLFDMGLSGKEDVLPHTLSGGMKRRLQLACALAGDADVLVLDEPTSGLDIETRRGLWDLLLALRGGRTVLLSTHFMEEADALGDRVAALHSGTLRCFATPMHLKKEIDTGYRLSLTLQAGASQAAAEAEVAKVLASTLPQATPLATTGDRTIAYKLPSRESSKFPAMFKKLETDRERLGIETIGVGVTTLEEVFLKICSNTVAVSDDFNTFLRDSGVPQKITGFALTARQFKALFIRRLRYVLHSWISFIIVQILVPLVIMALVSGMNTESQPSEKANNTETQLSLNVYKDMEGRRMISHVNVPLAERQVCCGLKSAYADNITSKLITLVKTNKPLYRKYLIGIELNDTAALAHYTTVVRHALPVAVNALSNALAAATLRSSPLVINTVNHPLRDASPPNNTKLKEPKSEDSVATYAAFIVLCVALPLYSAGSLASRERVSSTRQIHVIAGCPPELHWLASLTFHSLYAVLVLLVPMIIFAAILDKQHTVSQPAFLAPFSIVVLFGLMATIVFSYNASFVVKEGLMVIFQLGLYVLFGYIGTGAVMYCEDPHVESRYCMLSHIFVATSYFLTPQTFTMASARSVYAARLNAFCDLNRARCPNLVINEIGFDVKKCCQQTGPMQCYMCADKRSALAHTVALFVQFVVGMALLVVTERGLIGALQEKILVQLHKVKPTQRDEIVEEEHQYVQAALRKSHMSRITSDENPRGDVLLVSSVYKVFFGLNNYKVSEVVKGISFAIREGECFGLVGVNGAGKTTTFRMLTCESIPTRGTIVLDNVKQRVWNNVEYLRRLGYCPQFFGLDAFLTGRQNMELLLTLEGFSDAAAKQEAVAWLELADLMKYADKKLATYSGGCSRRLSSVAALGHRAPLSLLDEPTAGVDVAARRQLWRAVRAAQAQTARGGRRRAVLITSHSMDEMEALCARVAILRGGSLVALGSPAALRAAHKAGLVLYIKIRDLSAQSEHKDDLGNLKAACKELNWSLEDEYKTMLKYHVGKGLRTEYSALFSQLEELRARFSALVEDYAVSEATLEQVFLQYAKPDEPPKPEPVTSAKPAKQGSSKP